MGARGVGAAGSGQNELVVPVVVIGAVVEHHGKHRDFVLGRDPEGAGVEHQIAVGLQIDDEPAGSFVCQGDAQG
jgi:hypothetical protein